MEDRHAAEAAAALRRARELVSAPGPLGEETRAEIAATLAALSRALEPAIGASPAEARTVGHFVEVAAHEATRPQPSGSVLQSALDGLEASAERLGADHPLIAGLVGRLNDALAKIGI